MRSDGEVEVTPGTGGQKFLQTRKMETQKAKNKNEVVKEKKKKSIKYYIVKYVLLAFKYTK